MNTFGHNFRISIFGESHGCCIGCTIDGLPAGFAPDLDAVRDELALRKPKKTIGSTDRDEDDDFSIVSGFFKGRCTGMPLTAIFYNKDVVSTYYTQTTARPSHADYTAGKKYSFYNDYRGGGAFSGRMTIAVVFAGALAKQLLEKEEISIFSHIANIGGVCDSPFDKCMKEKPLLDRTFPLVDTSRYSIIKDRIHWAVQNGTSLGGIVECAALGLHIGIGDPFFNSAESMISHIMFSIPAVHGIEFGLGFNFANVDGKFANDEFFPDGSTKTNNSGGINGGITNGMPLIFSVCFRPVPTIASKQSALDMASGKLIDFSGNTRHDVCILPRGCVIVESAAAIAIYDLFISRLRGQ